MQVLSSRLAAALTNEASPCDLHALTLRTDIMTSLVRHSRRHSVWQPCTFKFSRQQCLTAVGSERYVCCSVADIGHGADHAHHHQNHTTSFCSHALLIMHAGFPLTDAELSPSYTVLSAHAPDNVDWDKYARLDTLVLLMAASNLGLVMEHLMRTAWAPETPVSVCIHAEAPSILPWCSR